MYLDPEMPDEFKDTGTPVENDVLLSAIGLVIASMRDEAVQGRTASGIEEIWAACEDAYLCIDESNRNDSARWSKSTTMSGPIYANTKKNSDGKSSAFVRMTSRYVDMGAAKICEIALPVDDKAFSLSATPVPELIKHKDNPTLLMDAQGQPLMRPTGPQVPGQPQAMAQASVADVTKMKMDAASKAAEKAEKRIYDWMVESNYAAEMRMVMHDAARLGVGVLKSPFPKFKTTMYREQGILKRKRSVSPGMRRVSPWDIFPDPSCGENIHDGSYIFERDKLTPAKLKALKKEMLKDGKPIYINSQIDKVITQGPDKCNESERQHNKSKAFEIWHFTGTISRADMVLMGAVGIEDLPDDVVEVNAIVTLVNDSVIRATINPLESGEFPYRVMPWSRREGSWAGVGPGEQVAMPQQMVNAATRALLNNAGQSAGAQTVIDQRAITPADGNWNMTPGKFWYLTDNAITDDVRKIFMSVVLPNLGPQLMAVIQYAFKLAEEATNIPLVTQGRNGPDSPETFGAAELQNNNAHTLLRSVAYILDDNITGPVVRDLYEWLLLDDDVPEDEKGDFQINAKGSIAMVEKAVQEQALIQFYALAKDPAAGIDPKKVVTEILRAKRLDPRKLEYSEEDLAKMASMPPPENPIITAAKLRAESAEKIAASHDQTSVQKSKMDTDRDTAYQNALNERARIQSESADKELALKRELEVFKENNSLKKELDAIKAQLAETAMKLNVQRELSDKALSVDVHKHQNPIMTPPTEPVGRAADGQAFSG
jgi:hypothetical protein